MELVKLALRIHIHAEIYPRCSPKPYDGQNIPESVGGRGFEV